MKPTILSTAVIAVLLMIASVGLLAANNDAYVEGHGEHEYIHLVRDDGRELLELSGGAKAERLQRSLRNAGATEAQVTQVMHLLKQTATAQDGRKEQQRELHMEIKDEYEAANPNRAKLERLIRQASDLQAQSKITALTTTLDIRQIVGDEVWGEIAAHGHKRRGRDRDRDRDHSHDRDDDKDHR